MNRPTIYFVDINDPDETGTYESNYRHTVLAADYDALLARAKTAEADFLAAAECNVEQRKTIQRFQTELATERLRADAAVGDANAAERRAAELEKAEAERPAAIPDATELAEAAARMVYESWSEEPGYVAWAEGGNSFKQDKARAIAKRIVSALRDAKAEQPAAVDERGKWDYCPECGSEAVGHEEGNHKQCADCRQEWWADIDYSDVVRKHLGNNYSNWQTVVENKDAQITDLKRAALAPAAVVMPERMTTIPEGKTISYAAGYEAALDAVASLNRTVPLGLLEQAIRCMDEKSNRYETHATKYATADQLRAILAGVKPWLAKRTATSPAHCVTRPSCAALDQVRD